MPQPFDLALRYDAALRRCDLVLSGRDLALDGTPATPMLLSIGADRRARPDDPLPDVAGDPAAPASLRIRRGSCLDAFDGRGRLAGSRLWLLARAKQTEETRRRAEDYATEALSWLVAERGQAVTVAASFPRAGILGLRCTVDGTTIAVQRALS